MTRLVTFGCSYTYGQALPDCWINNSYKIAKAGPVPSKYAWPALLGKKLNLEVVNLSLPGSSNKKIWHKIVNATLYPDDIVVVAWTHLSRHCLITSKSQYINIGPWEDKSPIGDSFFRFFNNNYDLSIDLNLRMSHISQYLCNKNIKNYHLFSVKDDVNIELYNNCNLLNVNFQDYHIDKALDNKHPGVKSQSKFTKKLYKEIIEKQKEKA